MTAIEFIEAYPSFIKEIEAIIKPELKPILDEMKEIDPHDLIRPEAYFDSKSHAFGLVMRLFVNNAKAQKVI